MLHQQFASSLAAAAAAAAAAVAAAAVQLQAVYTSCQQSHFA
jgi:hypothetical protein